MVDAVRAALAGVLDPEIRRPITELGMVKSVDVDSSGRAKVAIYLTISSCPMQDDIVSKVREAVTAVDGISGVEVELDVMSDEQRAALKAQLGGGEKTVTFAQPGSLTRVYAITSGKGGVGKSSVTANLAVAMAAQGVSVGLVDVDIYGHSIPHILGNDAPPTSVDGMFLPPIAHGVRFMSMLPFKPQGITQPIAFRGPMLHRYVESFLADVYWGDLDVLLLDLPPGTGDVAMSIAQLVPNAELVVVTTPQKAAADVAVRAGMMAELTHQKVFGVIENMSGFPCPHCGEPIDLFGVGGGALVAEQLSAALGTKIGVLGRIPFDVQLREGGDDGLPLVASQPTAPASVSIIEIAQKMTNRARGLVGMSLDISPKRD